MKLFSILLFSALSAFAAEEPVKLDMPWHLVDLFWRPQGVVTCESFSVDVKIEGEVPADLPLYIAPFGGGDGCTVNGVQCYGGLQTKPDGGDRGDRRVAPLGMPGFIFSRWGERSFEALRMSKDGACQSSGHEGDFVSVRTRHPWKAGTYRYTLRGQDREIREGKTNRWVAVFVYDLAADRETYVGAIRFPGDSLVIGNTLTCFVEIYGGPIPFERIPRLKISFGNHQADGKPVPMRWVEANHDGPNPLRARATSADGKWAEIAVSPDPVKGPRQYNLFRRK